MWIQNVASIHLYFYIFAFKNLFLHKFRPSNTQPFEIPEEALKINRPAPATNKLYRVEVVKTPTFGIKVIRNSTGSVV